MTKRVLVTGAAGFVGANLCNRLLKKGSMHIVGLDNMNDYYDVALKQSRLQTIAKTDTGGRFEFIKGDLEDRSLIDKLFEENGFEVVVHLAAQAGVRYSIENPGAYIDSNIVGFFNILEACRHHPVKHLVFASSSSVYGGNTKVPYAEGDRVDHPVSLYAATKKSNELMAHAYSKLYDIPMTGLRFFTVYGPAGRPDMAYFKFTDKMVRGEAIQVYNNGDMQRDFTYIDDIVEGVCRAMDRVPKACESGAKYKIYNLGGSQPVKLMDFITVLEEALEKEGLLASPVRYEFLPMQPGDVYQTFADATTIERDLSFVPRITIEQGLREFARWYRDYYRA